MQKVLFLQPKMEYFININLTHSNADANKLAITSLTFYILVVPIFQKSDSCQHFLIKYSKEMYKNFHW